MYRAVSDVIQQPDTFSLRVHIFGEGVLSAKERGYPVGKGDAHHASDIIREAALDATKPSL